MMNILLPKDLLGFHPDLGIGHIRPSLLAEPVLGIAVELIQVFGHVQQLDDHLRLDTISSVNNINIYSQVNM